MFQCGDAGAIDLPAQFFTAARFGGGGGVGFFADAEPFEIVAAVAGDGGIAAGGVVEAFFAAADGAVREIFGQVAVAAFLTFEQAIFKAFFDGVEAFVGQAAFAVGPDGLERAAEGLKAGVIGVEDRPVHKIEESLAAFLLGRGKNGLLAVAVIQVKHLIRRPVEVVFVLRPVVANLGGTFEDFHKHIKVMYAAHIHAGGADGLVHGDLLGGPLDVFIDRLGLQFGQEGIADKTAGQFDVVHQPRGGGLGGQPIDIADNGDADVVGLEVLHQLDGLFPVPADLGNQEFGAGGDFLFHLVILLHQRRFGVFERRDGGTGVKLVKLVPLAGLGFHQFGIVELADGAQQADRFDLKYALGGGGFIAGQGQDALDAALAIADQRAEQAVEVAVFAAKMGDIIQSGQQALGLGYGQCVGRVDVGHAAGILGKGDACQMETGRKGFVGGLPGLQKLDEGAEIVARPAGQFYCYRKLAR